MHVHAHARTRTHARKPHTHTNMARSCATQHGVASCGAAVMALASCPEKELDEVLAALQPVMKARKRAMKRHAELTAEDPEPEPIGAQDVSDDEEEEDLPDLDAMFPPKSALGLFLLESAANHSCEPNAKIVPLNQLVPVNNAGTDPPTEGRESDTAERGAGIAMVAARSIAAGEELTICYLGDLTPAASGEALDADSDDTEGTSGERGEDAAVVARLRRRALLREQYLFECACARCEKR